MVSLFPSGADFPTPTETLSYVSLTHPRTGESSVFLLNESSAKLFEIQMLNRGTVSNGSFLVEDPSVLVHNSQLKMFTRVDPLLILLGPVSACAPETGPFLDYMDVMNMMIENSNEKSGMTKILQVLNSPSGNIRERLLDNFFESKSVLDRCLVRISSTKIIDYLNQRLEIVLKAIDPESFVECTGNDANKRLVALELVRSYIHVDWYNRLVERVGFDTVGLYVEESKAVGDTPHSRANGDGPSSKTTKRPNANAAESQTAKKAREVAKSCMKMTSFFKPKGC